ncbi:hypothetical protein NBRC116584_05700 [Hydrogenophaga sp. 5NK40-0174]
MRNDGTGASASQAQEALGTLASSVSLRIESSSANDARVERDPHPGEAPNDPVADSAARAEPAAWKQAGLLLLAVATVSLAVTLTVKQQWVFAALTWVAVIGVWVWLSTKLRRMGAEPLFPDDASRL